jgi:hypothetical protein
MNASRQREANLTTVLLRVEQGSLQHAPKRSLAEKETRVTFIRAAAEDTSKLTQQKLADIWGITPSAVSTRFRKAGIPWVSFKLVYNLGGQANYDYFMGLANKGYRLENLQAAAEKFGLKLTQAQVDYIRRAANNTEKKHVGLSRNNTGIVEHWPRAGKDITIGGISRHEDAQSKLVTQAYNLAVADIAMVMGTSEAEAEKFYGPEGHNFLGERTPSFIAAHWHKYYCNHDHSKVEVNVGIKSTVVELTSKD